MGDEDTRAKDENELFERKKKVLVGRGGSSAVKKDFRVTDQAAFAEALKQNPKMTWLEFFATLKPKGK